MRFTVALLAPSAAAYFLLVLAPLPAYSQDTVTVETHRPVTVCNLDAWYAAFNVQPGERLYLAPTDRVRIW